MKIVFYGFSLEAKKGLTLDDFYKRLIECHENDFDYAEKKRIFLFDDKISSDYYIGGFITIKDQKKFLALQSSGQSMTYVVNELDENRELVEFNFFIINKKTNFGLYQHYHNSSSLSSFASFLRKKYKDFLEIDKQTELLKETEIKAIKKIKSHYYHAFLKVNPLYKPETFSTFIDEMKSISGFEFDMLSLGVNEPEFKHLPDYAKKVRHKISFKKDFVSQVKDLIKSIISSKNIKTATIRGRDGNDIERVYNLYNNPESYYEDDFDEMLSSLDKLDLTNLDNKIIQKLLEIAKENQFIFETQSK